VFVTSSRSIFDFFFHFFFPSLSDDTSWTRKARLANNDFGVYIGDPAVLLCALLIPLVISHPTIDRGDCPTAAALLNHCIDPASTATPNLSIYEPKRSSDLTVYVDSLQQMTRKAKATIAVLSTLIAYVSINSIIHIVRPNAFIWCVEDREERTWIASSRSWFDRKACRWLGVCGAAHIHAAQAKFGRRDPAQWADAEIVEPEEPWRSFWLSGANESEWDAEERARRQIPDYVLSYAPLVHLYSGEQFWPGDIAEHLYHTTPTLNYTPIQSQWDHPTLRDLNELNEWERGRHVFLTSNDDVQSRPPWLEGERNIPQTDKDSRQESWSDWDGRVDGDIPGDTEENRAKWYDFRQLEQEAASVPETNSDEHAQAQEIFKEELRKRYGGKEIHDDGAGGRSDAPAILVVMDKGNGITDAYWFYFYSFNLGNTVVNVRFGNHVGDWEHCLMRFYNGIPKALFFSAHQGGEAYSYEAVEKIGQRVSPSIRSARIVQLTSSSLSYTLLRAATPCTPQLEYMSTFFLGDYCTMSQTVVHCGIPCLTHKPTPMIFPVKICGHHYTIPPLRLNGSTIEGTGATSSTR
jgi:hypothetical protein